MLVILRENVENLGLVGDVVKVSDGYARNYLLPRSLVALADEGNVAAIEHQKRTLEKKRLAQKAASQEMASKLDQVTCTITRKVHEKDKIFGSVTTVDIADALHKMGHDVKKHLIQLDTPIKDLGEHSVIIKIDTEASATIKVVVSKE